MICVFFPAVVLSQRTVSFAVDTELVATVEREKPKVLPSPGGIVLRRRVLFLGPWAKDSTVQDAAKAWVRRLASLFMMDLGCQVAEPPISVEDLECRGYWFNPVAMADTARDKMLRKQVFTGTFLCWTKRCGGNQRCSLGWAREDLASMPLVTEAACRSRVTRNIEKRGRTSEP